MRKSFRPRIEVCVGDFSLVLEEEIVELPTAYDAGGPPPDVRLLIRHGDCTRTCPQVADLAESLEGLDFPLGALCAKNPSDMATIFSHLGGLGLPIEDSLLFEDLKNEYGSLTTLLPAFRNGELIWHERTDDGIVRRSLSLTTMQLS